jgi:hypothetical protein
MPFARIGRIDSPSKKTEWVADCRRADWFLPADRNVYESVGIIGYNKETGDTCFFDTVRTFDGVPGTLASPREQISNTSLPKHWMSPRQMAAPSNGATHCMRCHSAYPWLRTPAALHRKVATRLNVTDTDYLFSNVDRDVPENFSWPTETSEHGSNTPFRVVAEKDLNRITGHRAWSPGSYTFPQASPCVSCHRLGGGYFTARKSAHALGLCNNEDPRHLFCQGQDPRLDLDWHSQIFGISKFNFRNVAKLRSAAQCIFKFCYLESGKDGCPEH